jgi:putative PEP-CTERM system histidine kinase
VTLTFGLLSYGIAAIGFLLLTVLLAVGWEGRVQGVRLILACAVTTVWAALLALGAQGDAMSVGPLLLAEILRYGAWFIVLTGLMAPAVLSPALGRVLHGAWMGGLILLLALPLGARVGLRLPDPTDVLAYAGLLLSLLGLIALEQIYRNTREAGRYSLKFFVVATGAMFAYDLFLYSQVLLQDHIDAVSWGARAFIVLIMVPLLTIAARRNPQWSLNVFVSRHVVFYTTSFAVVGTYLLLMAFGGYLLRFYGGTWGRAAQLIFFAGAGIVLALLIASANVRRRLRVFLSSHFYRNKYDYRIEWLRFIQTLSAPEAEVETRDNAVRAMAQIIDSPGGVLFLRIDEPGQYKVAAAWPPDEFIESRRLPILGPADELIGFLQRYQWVIDLRELRRAPDVYRNISLPAFLHGTDRFRLIVPLVHVDTLIGLALLASPPPPFEPNYEDRDLLKTVGRHVAVHLAQLEADKRLAESRQFEAYHRLTAFVMHDLKNLAAQLALIVSNAERHRRNPEFVDDAISTIANSTTRMQRLIEQLQRREVQGIRRHVRLSDIAFQAAQRCQARQPRPVVIPPAEDIWVEVDPERLTVVVEHVIRNAQDATPDDGSVTLSVGFEDPPAPGEIADTTRLRVLTAVLSVADTGSGMSREFIQERLFKPFDTTKGSKGMGIGAYQVREYVQSLGGRVEVRSELGKGTRMSLRMPLALPPDSDAFEVAPVEDSRPVRVGGHEPTSQN